MGSQRARHDWVTNTITLSDWAGRLEEKKVFAVVTLFSEPEVVRSMKQRDYHAEMTCEHLSGV